MRTAARAFSVAFLLCVLLHAEEPLKIENVSFRVIPKYRSVKIEFNQDVPATVPTVVHIYLVAPDGATRDITAGIVPDQTAVVNRVLALSLVENDSTTPKTETGVMVVLTNPDLQASGPLTYPADAKKTLGNLTQALEEKVASEKTSDEKNLFAGLSVTVPTGGSDTQGSGDFTLNKELYASDFLSGALFDSLRFGLELKKNSAESADPRHFSTGVVVRKTFLFHGDQYRKVKSAIFSGNTGDAEAALADIQKQFWPSVFFDNGLSFEGDVRGASIGDISNLVFDSQVKLASATIGNRTRLFFVRVIPIGVEAGYNLKNDDAPVLDGQAIARLKFGGTLVIRYDAPEERGIPSRLELEVGAVDRHLLVREAVLNPVTKLVDRLENGSKYYAEADLKIYFFRAGKGRPGFRLGFKRGYLPPAFGFTKAFDAGFFYESSDDSTARQ